MLTRGDNKRSAQEQRTGIILGRTRRIPCLLCSNTDITRCARDNNKQECFSSSLSLSLTFTPPFPSSTFHMGTKWFHTYTIRFLQPGKINGIISVCSSEKKRTMLVSGAQIRLTLFYKFIMKVFQRLHANVSGIGHVKKSERWIGCTKIVYKNQKYLVICCKILAIIDFTYSGIDGYWGSWEVDHTGMWV